MQKIQITSDQIEYILQDIKPITGLEKNIALNIYSRFLDKITKTLQNKYIYPEIIDKIRKQITNQYYNSQINPGDSVGILTAQAIGERQTQLALDSFHSTGITTITVITGVPRFNELVNATKNLKTYYQQFI